MVQRWVYHATMKKKEEPIRHIYLLDKEQKKAADRADDVGRLVRRPRAHRITFFNQHCLEQYITFCKKEDEEQWRS